VVLDANAVASARRPADTPTEAISSLAPRRASPRHALAPPTKSRAQALFTPLLCLIPADETILISSTTKQGKPKDRKN
jgi:hypothetical protein